MKHDGALLYSLCVSADGTFHSFFYPKEEDILKIATTYGIDLSRLILILKETSIQYDTIVLNVDGLKEHSGFYGSN